MRLSLKGYFILGAATGVLSAAATFLPLGDAPAPKLFGYCFGIDSPRPRCDGIDIAFYLFPGLIFGLAFTGAMAWRGLLVTPRAIVFVLAASIGNALATMLCVGLFLPLSALLGLEGSRVGLALTGAISGVVGGGFLSGGAKLAYGAAVRRPIAAAALLGLLVPLMPEWPIAGNFVFYIVWQAGYAAALGAGMPPEA